MRKYVLIFCLIDWLLILGKLVESVSKSSKKKEKTILCHNNDTERVETENKVSIVPYVQSVF